MKCDNCYAFAYNKFEGKLDWYLHEIRVAIPYFQMIDILSLFSPTKWSK